MSGQIDRLPVTQLIDRYKLVKSAVYKRLEALGIRPEKIGNKSYINADQLKLMDELHEFIQLGRTTAEFLEMRGLPRHSSTESFESSGQSLGQSSELSLGQPDILQLIAAITAQLASKLQPVSEPDPFAYYEILEKAAQNRWHLSTSELAELLDLLPSEIQQYGDRFSEAGFVFTKEGYRSGGQFAWRVAKPLK